MIGDSWVMGGGDGEGLCVGGGEREEGMHPNVVTQELQKCLRGEMKRKKNAVSIVYRKLTSLSHQNRPV